MDLETGPPAILTGLAYGQAGDGEDLLSEEQAKTRMRTKTLDKNVLFVGRRDATPVIGNNKVKTAGNLVPQYLYPRYMFPVHEGILKKIVKHLF